MSPSIKLPLLLAGLLISVAGCAAVGPDYARPDAPTQTGYAMAGDAHSSRVRLGDHASAGPWWRALAAPALDQVIAQALSGSPTLDEADATLMQSQAALAAVRGQSLPQVGLDASVARQRANLQAFGFTGFGDVKLENPTFSLYSIGSGITYDLDLFRGQKRREESAQAQVEAQGWRAQAAYLTLTANVALQAVTIATLTAEIEAAEATIADDQKTVDLVERAAELGGSTQTAVLSGRTQLEQDRAALPPLKAELSAARHALALLVGRAPSDWVPPDFRIADFRHDIAIPVSLPSELVRRRPDILAAEADVHAATAEIGVATANLYPDIKLTASLTQGALDPTHLFTYDSSAWNLAAGLTAPLFDGGTLEAQRQAAVAAAKAADARYRRTVLTAFVEVADAMQALAIDDELIAAQRRAEDQATESLRLNRLSFEKGGGTLLAVLDAQRARNAAVSARVRAEGRRLADIVRLFVATGADWRSGTAGG